MATIQIPGTYGVEALSRFIDSEIESASGITFKGLREQVIADLNSIRCCITKLGGIPRSGLILNIRQGVIYLELPQQTLSRIFYTCDGGYQFDSRGYSRVHA